MSIKRRFSSFGFRFIGLYVLVYLISALGFIVLMFSALSAEIEDSIKRDIQREFHGIIAEIRPGNSDSIISRIADIATKVSPHESLYILKDENNQTLISNYPYEVLLEKGWVHFDKFENDDVPPGFEDEEDSFFEDIDLYSKNAHDEGYVGRTGQVGPYTLFIGKSLNRIVETKGIVARMALLLVPICIFLAILGGQIFNRMTMRRIEIINDHCRAIRNQIDLTLRVPNTKPGDEYGLLIANINAMLNTIDDGVKNLESVMDDIAHDLRTPLSRIKYNLEAGLSEENPMPGALQAVLSATLSETDKLLETFSTILRISQLDSGRSKANFKDVNMSDVIQTIVEAYGPDVENDGHSLIFKKSSTEATMSADKGMMEQLLSNLIENTLRHAPSPHHSNLTITIDVFIMNHALILTYEDNGRGILRREHQQVFQKFYRGDYSRAGAGNGLGLTLVKSIADLHNADVQLVTLSPGLRFRFTFPALNSKGL